MSEAAIAEARAELVDAQLHLADVLRVWCPGPHRYVQHVEGLPAWCPECGYCQTGVKVGE